MCNASIKLQELSTMTSTVDHAINHYQHHHRESVGPHHHLTVTFEDEYLEQSSSPPNSNGRQAQKPHRTSLTTGDKIYLDHDKVNSRRHSSEVKNILPKISISRAKSDMVLNKINPGHSDGTNGIEKRRTNLALKALACYINVRPTLQFKEHNYQSITKVLNLKSNKCRICSESIYFHCYECIQCKLVGHKKCLQNLYVKCPNKVMPPRLAVFGLDISDHNQISEVFSVCIREIESRPIHKLRGIYKTEPNSAVVDNLCLSFEFGPHLLDLSQVCPHDITGVIKEYLNRLSSPIFNQSLQNELIMIGKEWPVRKVPYTQSGLAILIFELRRLVGYLSPGYRNNLAYFIYHLKRISDRQNITEMSPNALGIIFANIIFRSESHTSNISEKLLKNGYQNLGNNMNINHRHCNGKSAAEVLPSFGAGVQIVLDQTFKIRVIELMILYANDIFA